MTKQEAIKKLKARGQAVYEVVKAIAGKKYDGKENKKNRQRLANKFGLTVCRVISANYTRGCYDLFTPVLVPPPPSPDLTQPFTFYLT